MDGEMLSLYGVRWSPGIDVKLDEGSITGSYETARYVVFVWRLFMHPGQ